MSCNSRSFCAINERKGPSVTVAAEATETFVAASRCAFEEDRFENSGCDSEVVCKEFRGEVDDRVVDVGEWLSIDILKVE